MTGRRNAGQRRSVRGRGMRRRAVGAGGALSAFFGFGIAPLAATPVASAEVGDVIIDSVTSLFESSTWTDHDALGATWDALLLQQNWDDLFVHLGDANFGGALFNELVYTPLHDSTSAWINSSDGQLFANFVNSLSGQYLIGDGADGTAANPNGGDAGLLFGDGGNGYGYYGSGGNAGWLFGNGGDAGSAVDTVNAGDPQRRLPSRCR